MTTATKTRSLEVVCPFCMGEDSTITLDLDDLNRCTCAGCDAEFSPDEAAAKLNALAEKWAKVARWVDNAPIA